MNRVPIPYRNSRLQTHLRLIDNGEAFYLLTTIIG
jgi:hypothetical protein